MKTKDAILLHMQKWGDITAEEAKEFYGINKLRNRIIDLKKSGYKIYTGLEWTTNKAGERVKSARYRLKEFIQPWIPLCGECEGWQATGNRVDDPWGRKVGYCELCKQVTTRCDECKRKHGKRIS